MANTTWINLEEAREALIKGRGRGVRIAILDTGVEVDHPDLAGMKRADDVHIIDDGLQIFARDGDGTDLAGHGTAIAGIIYKLAPEAEIGSIRVLNEMIGSKTDIIREGVRQAIDRGFHVLNCSLGCGLADHILRYKSWVDESYLKGMHIVAACNNSDFTKPEWPGYFPSVVTVNFGRVKQPEEFHYRHGDLVEFFAHGLDVDVAWKNKSHKKMYGSSFAVPHMAALLARILSVFPNLPPLQAKAALHQLAAPWAIEVAGENYLVPPEQAPAKA